MPGLPVNGVEDSVDLDFFKKFTLPLIKTAIRDYLRMDVVEFAPTITGTIRNFTQFKVIIISILNAFFHTNLEFPNPISGSTCVSTSALHV